VTALNALVTMSQPSTTRRPSKSVSHADMQAKLKTVPLGVPTLAQAHAQSAKPLMVLNALVTISQPSPMALKTSKLKLAIHADTKARPMIATNGVPTTVQPHAQHA